MSSWGTQVSLESDDDKSRRWLRRILLRACPHDALQIFETPCADDETRTSQGFQGFGFGDGGFQMSFGIGAFPFGIFATAFNINDGRPPPGIYLRHEFLARLYVGLYGMAHSVMFCESTLHTAAPGTPQHMDEQFLSRLFLFVALVIMFWLLIA